MNYLSVSDLSSDFLDRAPDGRPVFVICSRREEVREVCLANGCKRLNLNIAISERLAVLPSDDRPSAVSDAYHDVMAADDAPLYVENIEMLFDQRYMIDTVKLFMDTARQKNIVVVWPGIVSADVLEYAETGYEDYRIFDVGGRSAYCVR